MEMQRVRIAQIYSVAYVIVDILEMVSHAMVSHTTFLYNKIRVSLFKCTSCITCINSINCMTCMSCINWMNCKNHINCVKCMQGHK